MLTIEALNSLINNIVTLLLILIMFLISLQYYTLRLYIRLLGHIHAVLGVSIKNLNQKLWWWSLYIN